MSMWDIEALVEYSIKLADTGVVHIGNTDLGSRTDIDFSKLENTTHLALTNTNLKKFPEGICKLTTLTSLRLDKNGITTIPDCIADMKALKNLYLADNNITSLPPAMDFSCKK